MDRALRVFDALLRAVDARGWPVSLQADRPLQTQVTVLAETVAVRISEKVRQVERFQSKSETRLSSSRYAYEPTGVLSIQLTDDSSFVWNVRTWNDGKRQRLEACLDSVMIGFVEVAERRKARRRDHERLELEWAEAERKRLAAAEQREREKDRREELHRQIQEWSRSQEVRAYLALLREASKEHIIRQPDSRLARWIRWAEAYADRIDPMRSVEALPRDPEGYSAKPLDLDGFGPSIDEPATDN